MITIEFVIMLPFYILLWGMVCFFGEMCIVNHRVVQSGRIHAFIDLADAVYKAYVYAGKEEDFVRHFSEGREKGQTIALVRGDQDAPPAIDGVKVDFIDDKPVSTGEKVKAVTRDGFAAYRSYWSYLQHLGLPRYLYGMLKIIHIVEKQPVTPGSVSLGTSVLQDDSGKTWLMRRYPALEEARVRMKEVREAPDPSDGLFYHKAKDYWQNFVTVCVEGNRLLGARGDNQKIQASPKRYSRIYGDYFH